LGVTTGVPGPPAAGSVTVASVPSVHVISAVNDEGPVAPCGFTTVLFTWTAPFCSAMPVKSLVMATATPFAPFVMVTPLASAPAGL
jgi:hypothetical protein